MTGPGEGHSARAQGTKQRRGGDGDIECDTGIAQSGRAGFGVVGFGRCLAGNLSKKGVQMKRRTFVGAAASLPAVSILSGAARAQSKEIRMIESGGASGESIQKGYIDPLKAKTGITVVRESPSSLGKLRALVESGQTSTTLFELGSGIVLQAKKLGLIEKIDWPISFLVATLTAAIQEQQALITSLTSRIAALEAK